jgi:hypothetical protein
MEMPNIRIDLKNSAKNLFIVVLPGRAYKRKYQVRGKIYLIPGMII